MTCFATDIMTHSPITLTPENTLFDAHRITQQKGIRHIPVINSEQEIVAVITHKALITKVFSLIATYGMDTLADHEQQVNVMELAVTDYEVAKESDLLADIASFFVENKYGCIPVVNANYKLTGIITSSDFVRLAAILLNK